MDSTECSEGNILDAYQCSRWYSGEVCCKTSGVTSDEETCSEMGGEQCSSGETCSGNLAIAGDTNKCCIGTCKTTEAEETECESLGYTCKASCGTNEQTEIYDCDFSDKCCSTEKGSSYSWILIVLLVLLIILIVLAIIFRNQLKVWFFKRKGGVSSSNVSINRRPPMPPGAFARPMPRQMVPRPGQMQRRPVAQQKSGDKDFDETMNRLKNMTK